MYHNSQIITILAAILATKMWLRILAIISISQIWIVRIIITSVIIISILSTILIKIRCGLRMQTSRTLTFRLKNRTLSRVAIIAIIFRNRIIRVPIARGIIIIELSIWISRGKRIIIRRLWKIWSKIFSIKMKMRKGFSKI